MPWTYQPDETLDNIAKIRLVAADLQKRADSIHAKAQRELAELKQRHGLDSGHPDVPDLVKAAPKAGSAATYFEQEMVAHMLKAYPGDVRPVEEIHEANESLRADLHKAAPPAQRPLPNAFSAFPDSTADIIAFGKSRGMYPDLSKGAPDFDSGQQGRPGEASHPGKREGQIGRPLEKLETAFHDHAPALDDLNRDKMEKAHLASVAAELKASLTKAAQPDFGRLDNLDRRVRLQLLAGVFANPEHLDALADIPYFDDATRELAHTQAEEGRRQAANARGEPWLRRLESF